MKIIVLSVLMLAPTLLLANDERPSKPINKTPKEVQRTRDTHHNTTPRNIDNPVLPTSKKRAASASSQPPKKSTPSTKTKPVKVTPDKQ